MFEKGGVPMFDIHRPNVCEIPVIGTAEGDGQTVIELSILPLLESQL